PPAPFCCAVASAPFTPFPKGSGGVVAASAIGLLAVVSGGGRAVASHISDRFGRRETLTAALLLAGCAQLGLVYSASIQQAAPFVVFAALSGLAGGAFYPLLASPLADYFRERKPARTLGPV